MSEKDVILYVDDEPINLLLFKKNFEKTYTVITVESGHEGLEKLSNNPEIKVAISDMKMPVMNGVEFIRQAKREYPTVVFFILTGFEITEEIADALSNKLINKYFRKPFSIQGIDYAINEVIMR